jgi:DNA repair protein RecO (recombination protein O)
MPTYKAKGLIIKSYRLGEADKIVKIFTPDMGLISAVAKGAFNMKSRFSGRLELYNVIDCEFSQGRTLDIVSQAEILEIFNGISGDFLKFNYTQSLSEMILKTQSEKAASYNLFKLTYLVIKKMNNIDDSNEVFLQMLLIFFMINFSKIMGYAPMLKCCTVCGCEMLKNPEIFSVKYGGTVCRNCSSGKSGIIFFNDEEMHLLTGLLSCRLEELTDFKVSYRTSSRILDLMAEYVSFHSEINLSSLAYLKKIHKNIV